MVRPAPGVARAVSVLEFLAARPETGFTASELARRLDLNKATCHTVVHELASAGYIRRDPVRKTYTLGPVLIALGEAARSAHTALGAARPEMDSLAERLDLECLASAAAADEIVILDRAGRSAPAGSSALPGQRLPLAPPLGTVFVAWSPPEAVDAWLLRLGPDAPPDVIGRARAALATVRARGYSVGLDADARVKLGRALAELAHEPRVQELRPVVDALVAELGHEEYALVELGPSRSYPVNHIAAPVFDSAGAVVLALTVVGFTSRLGAGDVPAYAREVVAAAARVTAAIGGAPPA